MVHLRTVNKQTLAYIDTETSEVIKEEVKEHKILVDEEKSFFFTYAKAISVYKNLNGTEIKVISWIMANAPLNNNVVALTKSIKEKIAKEMEISYASVNCSIRPLVNKDVLIKEGSVRSATYIINPEFYWKGAIANRKRALMYKLEIEFYPSRAKT